jgi:DNA repair exonuclease SbcCD ATPase subunit
VLTSEFIKGITPSTLSVCYQFGPPLTRTFSLCLTFNSVSTTFSSLQSHIRVTLSLLSESILSINTMRTQQKPNKATPSLTMDEETAKEIEDLQNNLKALIHRKRKREEATLEHENGQLKTENQKLKNENKQLKGDQDQSKNELKLLRYRLTLSTKKCSMANAELTDVKQSKKDLETDNKRLKNELDQEVMFKVFLQRDQEKLNEKVVKQAETIKAHTNETRQLRLEIGDLHSILDKLQNYKAASQKAVLDLKEKRRLEMEAEFKILVSHYTQNPEIMSGYQSSNNATGRDLRYQLARSLEVEEQYRHWNNRVGGRE